MTLFSLSAVALTKTTTRIFLSCFCRRPQGLSEKPTSGGGRLRQIFSQIVRQGQEKAKAGPEDPAMGDGLPLDQKPMTVVIPL
jgi:hypothetical protein